MMTSITIACKTTEVTVKRWFALFSAIISYISSWAFYQNINDAQTLEPLEYLCCWKKTPTFQFSNFTILSSCKNHFSVLNVCHMHEANLYKGSSLWNSYNNNHQSCFSNICKINARVKNLIIEHVNLKGQVT